jgi:hypothetical protein
MQTIIKTYIRDEKTNQPHGIAVAIKNGNKVDYGFSLCNLQLDNWNKKLGTEIAIARASAPQYQLPGVKEREQKVLDAYNRLEKRAIKYFKDLNYEDVALTGHLGFEDVNL